jgi:SAM-dependent methyltransferase
MLYSDMFNLALTDSSQQVDQINKGFYGRFNYPWTPSHIPGYPPDIAALFLNQDIGFYRHTRISPGARIWVAGCGTNQALFTALRFPQAEVIGTDISTPSLEVCEQNARQLGIRNLQLQDISLNDITYEEQFDYIICTGVVHHNARPAATLSRIAAALKKNGILELMVYNYYHRLLTTACQKAVREFYDTSEDIDIDLDLWLIKKMMKGYHSDSLMMGFLASQTQTQEAEMADRLLQPVEHSYTIASLEKLAGQCNLEFLNHCLNQFDVNTDTLNWNVRFNDPELQSLYDRMPDIKRWQIGNLLLFNKSPMLWFYFQRTDSPLKRRTEREICEEFLNTTFRRNSFPVRNRVLHQPESHPADDRIITYPVPEIPRDPSAYKVFDATDGRKKMKDIFNHLNIVPSFSNVQEVRLRLATSVFPYLLSVEN